MSSNPRIAQYELLARIGEGGMGAVYRGRDPRFDRPVAVKVLHPHFARLPEVAARFRSEAVIQAKLNHPNIATVYDFVGEGETLAFVMELIDGETLEHAIVASGGRGLGERRAAAILAQVLSAIGHAHAHGLVHRDLKPSNIMLQRFGTDEVSKVMDFGVAKILGSEKVRTATGAKMGTLAYMSPEQVQSPKEVDARSDLYSLGIVLYEMVTGKIPFDASSEYELMTQIVRAPIRTAEIRGPIRAVIENAVAKAPADRFQSAAEFREMLLRVLNGQHDAPRPQANPRQEQAVPRPAPRTAPAPRPGKAEWFVRGDEREYGPYRTDHVECCLRTGWIAPTTLVRRDSDPSWTEARAYGELSPTTQKVEQAVATIGNAGEPGMARVALMHDRFLVWRAHDRPPLVAHFQDVRYVLAAKRRGWVQTMAWVIAALAAVALLVSFVNYMSAHYRSDEEALTIVMPISLVVGAISIVAALQPRSGLEMRLGLPQEMLRCRVPPESDWDAFVTAANVQMERYKADLRWLQGLA